MSTSKAYILIKNFALKEIVSPMSNSEFIDGINFIKKEIEHLKDYDKGKLTGYIEGKSEIIIYQDEFLITIEYQDLDENINFEVSKFLEV